MNELQTRFFYNGENLLLSLKNIKTLLIGLILTVLAIVLIILVFSQNELLPKASTSKKQKKTLGLNRSSIASFARKELYTLASPSSTFSCRYQRSTSNQSQDLFPLFSTPSDRSSFREKDAPNVRIPLLIHQINSHENLPAQFLFSLSSVARYHNIAIDDCENCSKKSHTFKYYFWTDQSIRDYVSDLRNSESLLQNADTTSSGVILADIAYHF